MKSNMLMFAQESIMCSSRPFRFRTLHTLRHSLAERGRSTWEGRHSSGEIF